MDLIETLSGDIDHVTMSQITNPSNRFELYLQSYYINIHKYLPQKKCISQYRKIIKSLLKKFFDQFKGLKHDTSISTKYDVRYIAKKTSLFGKGSPEKYIICNHEIDIDDLEAELASGPLNEAYENMFYNYGNKIYRQIIWENINNNPDFYRDVKLHIEQSPVVEKIIDAEPVTDFNYDPSATSAYSTLVDIPSGRLSGGTKRKRKKRKTTKMK